MPDADITAIRALLASRARPTGAAERRERLDDLGRALGVPEQARLEPIQIDDVPAEWSTTPEADPARAVLYLHGGGYMAGSIVSHRYVAVEIGRAARTRTLALSARAECHCRAAAGWSRRGAISPQAVPRCRPRPTSIR